MHLPTYVSTQKFGGFKTLRSPTYAGDIGKCIPTKAYWTLHDKAKAQPDTRSNLNR